MLKFDETFEHILIDKFKSDDAFKNTQFYSDQVLSFKHTDLFKFLQNTGQFKNFITSLISGVEYDLLTMKPNLRGVFHAQNFEP